MMYPYGYPPPYSSPQYHHWGSTVYGQSYPYYPYYSSMPQYGQYMVSSPYKNGGMSVNPWESKPAPVTQEPKEFEKLVSKSPPQPEQPLSPVASEARGIPALKYAMRFLCLAVAGSLLYKGWQKIKNTTPPAKAGPLKPLLKLEDFQVPPGLETPEKRLEKTTRLVNTVFPKLVELAKNHQKNPYWQAEFNHYFNKVFNEQICPNSRLLICFNELNFANTSSFVPVFESKRVKDCYLTDSQRDITPCPIRGLYRERMIKGLSLEEMNRPVYYLGRAYILSPYELTTDYGKAYMYRLLVHESTHAMNAIAEGPTNTLKRWEQCQTLSLIENEYYALGSIFLRKYLDQRYGKDSFPELTNEGLSLDLSQPENKHKLRQLTNKFLEISNNVELFVKDDSYWPEKNLQYLKSLSPEELKLYYRTVLVEECEAYTTLQNRFADPECPIRKELYFEDLGDAIRAFGLQVQIRKAENLLQTPEEQRNPLSSIPLNWKGSLPEI